jgi:hypothetical protein
VLAPVQSGAASILSSCVYFLAMCCLVHCVLEFSRSSSRCRASFARRLSAYGRGTPRPAIWSLEDIRQNAAKRTRSLCLYPRKNGPTAALPTPAPEPNKGSLQFSATIQCDQYFPLVMPFLWELPPQMPDKGVNVTAKLPCSAASALCPFRVARVSRLIGKSDTTAKRPRWQVYFRGYLLDKLGNSAQNGPECKKRHSDQSGVSLSCAGHWPPKQLRTVVISTAPSAGSSGRFPLLRGRYLGGCSCRILLFFGLAGIFSSSRYITGTLDIAIHWPFQSPFIFR